METLPNDALRIILNLVDVNKPALNATCKLYSTLVVELPSSNTVCIFAAKNRYKRLLQWMCTDKCKKDPRITEAAVKSGYLRLVMWLCRKKYGHSQYMLMRMAVKHGHLDICRWLNSEGCVADNSFAILAGKGGHRDVYDWIANMSLNKHSSEYIKGALAGGFIDILEDNHVWPRGQYSDNLVDIAVENGRFSTVRWLHDNDLISDTYSCDTAAKYGCFRILKWLVERGYTAGPKTCIEAAGTGDFEMLQWLREFGVHWDEITTRTAARKGHWDVLKWSIENGCPTSNELLSAALYGKCDTNMFQWLLNRGCKIDGSLSEAVGDVIVQKNNVSELEYYISLGIRPDEYASSVAASSGAIDVLKYLVINKYPLDDEIIALSPVSNTELIMWLVTNGCVWDGNTLEDAIREGNVELVTWLVQIDDGSRDLYATTELLEVAVEEGNVHLVRWMIEKGFEWGEDLCNNAAASGDLDMLKLLRENHPGRGPVPWDFHTCCAAARSGKLETLTWAIDNGCEWKSERDKSDNLGVTGYYVDIVKYAWEKHLMLDYKKIYKTCIRLGYKDTLEWIKGEMCWGKRVGR